MQGLLEQENYVQITFVTEKDSNLMTFCRLKQFLEKYKCDLLVS